jgi:hypothetical protein
MPTNKTLIVGVTQECATYAGIAATLGLEPVLCHSPVKALIALGNKQVAFCSMFVEGISGPEFKPLLFAGAVQRQYEKLPVLFIGYPDDVLVQRVRRSGCIFVPRTDIAKQLPEALAKALSGTRRKAHGIGVIETNDTTRAEICAILERHGCNFEAFADWDQALDRMRQRMAPYVHVVTNLGEDIAAVMEYVNGEMRKIPGYEYVNVTLHSRHSADSIEDEGITIEGQVFYVKKTPQDHEMLIRQIELLARGVNAHAG